MLHDGLDGSIIELAPDQALCGVEGVLGVGDGLTLCHSTHQTLALLGDGNHGRGGAGALAVLQHTGVLALHDRDARVGGAQVDADDLVGHGAHGGAKCGGSGTHMSG